MARRDRPMRQEPSKRVGYPRQRVGHCRIIDIEARRWLRMHASCCSAFHFIWKCWRLVVLTLPEVPDMPGCTSGVRIGGHQCIVPEEGQQEPKGDRGEGGPNVFDAPSFLGASRPSRDGECRRPVSRESGGSRMMAILSHALPVRRHGRTVGREPATRQTGEYSRSNG